MSPWKSKPVCALFAAAVICGGGCRAGWYDTDYRQDRDAVTNSGNTSSKPIAKIAGPSAAQAEAKKPPKALEKSSAQVDEAVVAGVMEKVYQVSEIDPAAAAQLLAELQEMPPTFWPAAAEQFRSSLAYRQQREAKQSAKSALASRDPMHEADNANRRPSAPPAPTRDRAMAATNDAGRESAVQQVSFNDIQAALRPDQPTQPPSIPSEPLARQPFTPSPKSLVRSTDWHSLTQSAADDLERRVAPSPASTAEVHEHVTLRILRLLHGDTERSLAPIPGLSPAEQDYWSRQLFALATYLDHHSQPDDKRRAAASALHLDEALDSLRDVGSLTLRNLTICKKVIGYGAYEPYEISRFSPGQPLALYVEVENYHSESTGKGYVTLLGSSYELLDDTGRRVGGDSFPDVEDTCRSRRRDFHVQFGLTLPAKIEPGHYRLLLTVRDRQGDKIGTSAVEFDVAGASTPAATSPTAKAGGS